LDHHERDNKQKTASGLSSIKTGRNSPLSPSLTLPKILNKNLISPFQGTKFDGSIVSPYTEKSKELKEEYHKNENGTYSMTKEQTKLISARKAQVDERLKKKHEFRKDID